MYIQKARERSDCIDVMPYIYLSSSSSPPPPPPPPPSGIKPLACLGYKC
jgi:hypothetical protein